MKTGYTGKWLYTADAAGSCIENFAMLAEDGRIVWIRPQDEADRAEADAWVDLGDVFVTPGFIDCHVHLAGDPAEETYESPGREAAGIVCEGAAHARQLLHAGVVACRDLGSYRGYALGIRDAVNRGLLAGPKILACGQAVCARGGHGYEISYEVDGADGMRGAVRQAVKDGADVIKLMVSGGVNSPGPEPGPCELTREEIETGVETAHAWGRKVGVHTHGNTAIRLCVEAGVDSIEHGVFMTEDIMDRMAEKGTFLVPTLCAPYYAVEEGIRREPDNPDHKKSREVLGRHRGVLKQCAEKGVKIAMGTDAGCPFNPFDKAAHEMVLMVMAGLTPRQALDAATRGGAELLELSELGSLEPGKKASFVCLKGNPLKEIESVDQVAALYLDGKEVLLG